MNRAARLVSIVVLVVFVLASCMTHVHTVGEGPQSFETVSERQWYVLWGLVDITTPDTERMAAGAEDYEIVTEFEILDVVIGFFTGIATVYPRTVKVIK
ncbi:MAG: hypothetical protein EA404_12130 [Spirochaetaceae bacterium]|nr:MAG: hypothetical protein EA404_12130 [Spirochaetaceae bacterium]